MTTNSIEVGSLYHPERTRWRQTDQLIIASRQVDLVHFWEAPNAAEITSLGAVPSGFALVDESPDLLVFAYKYPGGQWCDVPFQAHRVPTAWQGIPRPAQGYGLGLSLVLVDALTGIVRGLSVVGLSPQFSARLVASVTSQLAKPFDDGAAGRRLNDLYARFPTAARMVAERADAVFTTRS